MRQFLDINLKERTISAEEWEGEQLVKAGRYLIAKMLVDEGVATVDPLGPDNPLIFSAGPFAGTTFSNANRISIGCKSPLTGGIKEANGGGTFAYAMGRIGVAGFVLRDQCDDWTIMHFDKKGNLTYKDASPYLGKDNFTVAKMLHAEYGKKISLAITGPVGEYLGLLGGIAISDNDNRPSRLAARGGVGAVMGSKKVKAIVIEVSRMPPLMDKKKTLGAVRQYAAWVQEDHAIQTVYNPIGTMAMGDFTNHVGGMPTNNFTSGSQPLNAEGQFQMGGEYVRDLNNSRGGKHTHACMPGCLIQCSNVYYGEDGKEMTSPVEYETLSLLGTNCGLTHPDNLGRMNHYCNMLGVDTIETGATIAVLMDSGLAPFGDVNFMEHVFQSMLKGTDEGKLWAQGTYRVGKHYGNHRIPTIKKQAISAYDPRVIEVTGVSMMVSAQGADHTAGNVAKAATFDKGTVDVLKLSLEAQIAAAAVDSIGMCIFGRSVTNVQLEAVAGAMSAAIGGDIKPTFFHEVGRETLALEREFNIAAGFTEADDNLPQFFYDEPLNPTNRTARFNAADVHNMYDIIDQVGTAGVPDEYGRVTA